MNEIEGRKRLGAKVKAERTRKYRTVDAARIAAQISRGAWDNVEHGQSVKDLTLNAVEEALGWPAGRAQQIIDGEDESWRDYVDSLNLSPETYAHVVAAIEADMAAQQVTKGREAG